jgi:hypothetical protein
MLQVPNQNPGSEDRPRSVQSGVWQRANYRVEHIFYAVSAVSSTIDDHIRSGGEAEAATIPQLVHRQSGV